MLGSPGAVAAGTLIFGSSGLLLFLQSGQDRDRAAPLKVKIATIIFGPAVVLTHII